jgi:mRNA-degrading endonuclease toxin of MazEF toxin-antitoxin module
MPTMNCRRGDVVLVLFPDSNLRTSKRRPALVVQSDQLGTELSQTIVAMITSNMARAGRLSTVTDAVAGALVSNVAYNAAWQQVRLRAALVDRRVTVVDVRPRVRRQPWWPVPGWQAGSDERSPAQFKGGRSKAPRLYSRTRNCSGSIAQSVRIFLSSPRPNVRPRTE